jgi:hypothetical protein
LEPGSEVARLAHLVIGAAIEVHRLLINFNVPYLKSGIKRVILSS